MIILKYRRSWIFWAVAATLSACEPGAQSGTQYIRPGSGSGNVSVVAFATPELIDLLKASRRRLAKRITQIPPGFCVDHPAAGPVEIGGGEIRAEFSGECRPPDDTVTPVDPLDDPPPEGAAPDTGDLLLQCEEDSNSSLACRILEVQPGGPRPGTVYRLDRPYIYSEICGRADKSQEPRCIVRLEPIAGDIDPAPNSVEANMKCEELPELCRLPLDLVTPRPPARQTDAEGNPCGEKYNEHCYAQCNVDYHKIACDEIQDAAARDCRNANAVDAGAAEQRCENENPGNPDRQKECVAAIKATRRATCEAAGAARAGPCRQAVRGLRNNCYKYCDRNTPPCPE